MTGPRSRTVRHSGALVVLSMLLAACAGGAAESDATERPAGDAAAASASSSVSGSGSSSASSSTSPQEVMTGAPTTGDLERARQNVAELSLPRLAGQLVVASYQGSDPQVAADLVSSRHLAGVITLGGNVPPEPADRIGRLSALTAAVTAAVERDQRDWPAFLAIDQEGGPVTRVGAPLTDWPAAMALGAANDPDLATEVARASGLEIRALGYTVLLAPVVDVTTGPQDPTIGVRSPGSDPSRVARMALAQTRGYLQAGLVPVAKHFPGHGSVSSDTHLGMVRQEAGMALLRERDLVPFAALAEQGAPAVMSAHIVVEAVDATAPATMSAPVLTGLLREELGFSGLVVTDALDMQAVTEVSGPSEAAVRAIEAGADVLLMPTDPGAAVDGLVQAVQDGRLSRERLVESAARVVATLRVGTAPAQPPSEVIGAHDALAERVAAAAVTRLDPACDEAVLTGAVQVLGGRAADRERFRESMSRAGLDEGQQVRVTLVAPGGYSAAGEDPRVTQTPVSGTDVVVTLGEPYPLAGLEPDVVALAAFDDSRAAMDAVVAVLTGAAEASGSLPVAVGDHPVGSGCTR